MKDYCFCKSRDGFLYVETPSFDHLRNLILNQRFRDSAHFRTLDGFVPYLGGGAVFDVAYLRLLGVQPLWYLRKGGSYELAERQLLQEGIYADEHDVYKFNGHQYAGECEWLGKRGLRFDVKQIKAVWIGRGKDKRSVEERLGILAELLPKTVELWSEPLEATGVKPCGQGV